MQETDQYIELIQTKRKTKLKISGTCSCMDFKMLFLSVVHSVLMKTTVLIAEATDHIVYLCLHFCSSTYLFTA